MFKLLLEKMWEKGEFMTDFGKSVYKNEDIILEDTLKIPEWLNSNNEEDFNELMSERF